MKLLFFGFCIYVIIQIGNVSQSQSLLGGFKAIPVDNEKVKQLATFSLNSIAQKSSSKNALGLIRVLSAKSQVVSGINYKIQLLACEKDSTKEENNALDEKCCRSCGVTIWEQEWLNKKTVTSVSCSKPADLVSFSTST